VLGGKSENKFHIAEMQGFERESYLFLIRLKDMWNEMVQKNCASTSDIFLMCTENVTTSKLRVFKIRYNFLLQIGNFLVR
jgi:hypothetical protein